MESPKALNPKPNVLLIKAFTALTLALKCHVSAISFKARVSLVTRIRIGV